MEKEPWYLNSRLLKDAGLVAMVGYELKTWGGWFHNPYVSDSGNIATIVGILTVGLGLKDRLASWYNTLHSTTMEYTHPSMLDTIARDSTLGPDKLASSTGETEGTIPPPEKKEGGSL